MKLLICVIFWFSVCECAPRGGEGGGRGGSRRRGSDILTATGMDRAFIYSHGREYTNLYEAKWIGNVLEVEDSSECCQACWDEYTDRQTGLFNFERGYNLTQCTCLEQKIVIEIITKRVGFQTGTCDNDGGTVDVDGDLGDGKAFSTSMDDLYLGKPGPYIYGGTCCALCQRTYPETQMFQYHMDRSLCDCYKTPEGEPVPTHRTEYVAGTCAAPVSCDGTSSDWDCCSSLSPCQENEGDCDNDSECAGSLVCGNDNCPSINPLAHRFADCCIKSTGTTG